MSAEAKESGDSSKPFASVGSISASACPVDCSAQGVLPAGVARKVSGSPSAMHTQDVHEAERLASMALQSRDFSEDTLVRVLACALPPSQPNPRPKVLGAASETSYAVLGHFCSKAGEGITVHCQKAPSAVKLVNAFLLQFGFDCFWGSIAVAHNCPSLPRRDAANCPLSHNLSIAIGRFQGGGLVVESDYGDRTLIDPATELPAPAMLMDSCRKPVLFSPLKLRASEPWQGDRWSLNAYCLRSLPHVDPGVARDLVQLGFPLPPQVMQRCKLEQCQLSAIGPASAFREPSRVVSQDPVARIVREHDEPAVASLQSSRVVKCAWPPLDFTL